jgi:hypothetical protein
MTRSVFWFSCSFRVSENREFYRMSENRQL